MQTLRNLFNSKKFIASLVATATAVALELGFPEVAVEQVLAAISPLLTYIGAQGFADMGKERAKVEQGQ